MSVDRALEVLGLSGSPTKEEIRRAYLRKVKEHPPERDRDGFVLVREAFDFLKSGIGRMYWPGAPVTGGVILSEPEPEPEPESEPESEPVAKVSFPADDFERQFELLNEALATDDPVAAAKAMITLYSRPILEAGPIPPPLFCLQTFMLLVEQGNFEPAHELLKAFEQHAALHRVESGFGNEVGARWRLTRELQAICDIDQPLASAVARGLRIDNLGRAASQAQAAQARGLDMRHLLSVQAPTIYSSLASLIKPGRDLVPPGWSLGSGWSLGTWPIGVIAVVLIHLARLCSPSSGSSGHTESYTPSVQQVPSPEPDSDSDSEQPKWAEMSPEAMRLSFRERAEQMADKQWQSLNSALQRGDCQDVATRWPIYRTVAPDDVVDPATTAARKKQILEMCAELQPLLEDKP